MGPALTASARRAGAGLAGAVALIAGITVASRLAGFVRSLVLVSAVGPNALGDAYQSANLVPTVLFEVVAGGALAGAVVPLLAAPLARGSRDELDRIASALIGWSLVVLVPLGSLLALASRPLAGALLGGADPAAVAIAATFLQVFAIQVPAYGVAVVLFGVLQAHHRFAWPALAPLLNNVLVIGVLAAFGRLEPGPKDDPAAVAASALALLGWGTTAGVLLMAVCVVVPALRTGWRPTATLRLGSAAPRARSLLAAGVGAVAAQQLTTLTLVRVANQYGEDGAAVVLLFVQQVFFLPYAVLAYPLITAAFPRLAGRVAAEDRAGFARLSAGTTRAVLVVAVTGAAALVAGATGVQELYAGIADVDAGAVASTAGVVAAMAPALVGYVLGMQASRGLYALHRGRAAGLTVGAGWVAVAVLALLLVPTLGDRAGAPSTLALLGLATTAGLTLGGAAATLALARAAGSAAVAGLARTAAVVGAAGVAGALLGRLVGGVVLGAVPGSVTAGLLAAGLAALVAAVVVLAAVMVGDRSALAGLRRGAGAPG